MFKKSKIIGVCLTLVLLASVSLGGAYWPAHKSDVTIYRIDLGGVGPTLAQVAAANIKTGDIIVDTSTDNVYINCAGSVVNSNLTSIAGSTFTLGEDVSVTFYGGPAIIGTDSNTITSTYSGTGVAMAEWVLASGAASNLVADADTMEIIMSSKSSLNVAVEYGTLGLLINDVTDGTEDAYWILRGQSAGSEADFLTIGSSAAGVQTATFLSGMNVSATLISNLTGYAYASNITVTTGGSLVTPEITLDSQYVMAAASAQLTLTGSFTNGQAEVVFGTYFGGVPVVFCQFTNDLSSMTLTNALVNASAVTTSNFVPLAAAPMGSIAINANYIAVGARP